MTTSEKKKEIPDELGHYTTLDGFVSIIRSQAIWASNVSFLNDKLELTHALKEAVSALKKLSSKTSNDAWGRSLRQAAKRIDTSDAIPPTFVACFCEKPDLLSQWRGYGGNEQGICIIFKRSHLERRFQADEVRLRRVQYTKVSTPKRIFELMDSELRNLRDIEELVSFNDTEREEKAFEAICGLLPQFKHLGFSAEREWRFVTQGTMGRDRLKYRTRGGVIVPYIELGAGAEHPLAIERVCIGPSKDPELTQRSVRWFLDAHGYGLTDIEHSEVPYRI